jgi:hypothetical protein
MRTTITTIAFAVSLAAATAAQAQEFEAQGGGGGSATGFGVGVQTMLTGPSGPSFTYQASSFHIDGIFTFDTGVEDRFFRRHRIGLGGRFFWELHAGSVSDFSVGVGVGIADRDRGPNRGIDVHVEGAAQIRAFIVPNVALSATFGLAMEILDRGDRDVEVGFVGDLFGAFGITYFFF